jgi:glycosyltransferase involved in cell wall biosynthesis
MTRAVFAIPGDKDQRTGGYIYDATVLRLLNESGQLTEHLELPGSFPDAPPGDMALAIEKLSAIPAAQPIIVDGLALGAMTPEALGSVRAPIIALVHHPLGFETGIDPVRAAALIRNEAEVLQRVAHVIVTSTHIAQKLTEDFGVAPSRITVAHPGFDRPLTERSPVSPPLILSVGLLAQRKGHDVLIDALQLVSDLPWQARILGRCQDAAYTTSLRAQIDRAGLAARVSLAGEVEGTALQAAYQSASLFALATRYEGFGMVLGEAMMHGLPVVSCAVGAVPGTVGSAGHLVPPDDPEAFAAALRRLLEDPGAMEASVTASLARASTLTTWQATVDHFARIITQVAS